MSKKLKDMESMGKDELNKKMTELNKELIKLNAQVATGTPPKNSTSIRNMRRMIARLLMILNKKEMEEKLFGKKTEVKKA
ncbi:50S ribosomal protein L29 [Candidatus Woesearchaeota archaeon CG10_big_fil_rev_8_21_14_0_10_44_13]|nr:MAG: 50S ribosomal protein L29 [Candidatus Woesearchaeota archaeon CG10_big_fil_rev_8_21_14_0_10_44_13]